MASITKLMMKCIKCEIFNCEVEQTYFENISAEEWKQVYFLSRKHDLSHVVGNFVLRNKLISDAELNSMFNKQVLIAFQRFVKQNYELECIRKVLESNGIPFVVLKGPVIRKLYPDEWLRTSCDIDILVEEGLLDKAQKLLENELNYCAKGKGNHDVSMYSPSGVHLELHFSLLDHTENFDAILQKPWDYTEPVIMNSTEKIFTPEFLIFYIVSHLQKHFVIGGCGIRPFIDLKILLEKTAFDKMALNKMLKASGIDVFFEKAVLLSNIWFGDAEYDELSRSFEQYVLEGGVYGTIKNRVLSEQTKETKTQLILNRIFMPYSLLCDRYPNKKIKKYQTPYYQIVRWIDLIKEGSVKKGVRELKIQALTEKDEIDKTQRMMKDLGL